jgi:hypothetical protein
MGVNVTADPEGHVKEQDHDSPQDDYCNVSLSLGYYRRW